jgi:hypothetical protein
MDKAEKAYGHWIAPRPFPLEADYGYGTMIGNAYGHKSVGHGGWVNGFVSQFNRYTDDDLVVIEMWNFETASQMAVTRDLEAILFGAPYKMPVARPIAHPNAETLARYVGDFQLGPMTLKITQRNGKLYVYSAGQPVPYGLVAVSDTEFFCNDSPTQLKFLADEKGGVNQMYVNLMGLEMTAVRAASQKPGL